jgi:FG-GAP-like repeat/Trypsin
VIFALGLPSVKRVSLAFAACPMYGVAGEMLPTPTHPRIMNVRRIPGWTVFLAAATLEACTMNAGQSEETNSRQEPIVNGSTTSAAPEISQLLCNDNGCCTATLVETQLIITASHCFDYQHWGPPVGTDYTIKFNGAAYHIDWIYGGGSTPGATDFALARLNFGVPPWRASPRPIAAGAIAPSQYGNVETFFGYGCLNRNGVGGGVKRYMTQRSFVDGGSSVGCPGDSGGPVVYGGVNDFGPIKLLGSYYNSSSGADYFASGVEATPFLEAVSRLRFTTYANDGNEFAGYALQSGTIVLAGRFNGDSMTDLVAMNPGWSNGSFMHTALTFGNVGGGFYNYGANNPFANFSFQDGVQRVVADFDGDHFDDIAFVGGAYLTGIGAIAILYSNGNGTFTGQTISLPYFPGWAATQKAQVVAGDFMGDGGRADLAITGPAGWCSIPVAESAGRGSFIVHNEFIYQQPTFYNCDFANLWASTNNVQALAGDFDGDGHADIALTGGIGWGTVPVAKSLNDGRFNITNNVSSAFPTWSGNYGLQRIVGDFDGDGRADIALTGGWGWTTIPIAFGGRDSNQFGTSFATGNFPIDDVPGWARVAGTKVFAGRINSFGEDGLILAGGYNWGTVPVVHFRKVIPP